MCVTVLKCFSKPLVSTVSSCNFKVDINLLSYLQGSFFNFQPPTAKSTVCIILLTLLTFSFLYLVSFFFIGRKRRKGQFNKIVNTIVYLPYLTKKKYFCSQNFLPVLYGYNQVSKIK